MEMRYSAALCWVSCFGTLGGSARAIHKAFQIVGVGLVATVEGRPV